MLKDKSWQFESVDDLQEAQKKDRTSVGIVTPREITKVEAADRSEEDARSLRENLKT